MQFEPTSTSFDSTSKAFVAGTKRTALVTVVATAVIAGLATPNSVAYAQTTSANNTGDNTQESKSHRQLSSNDCLRKLDDNDLVIASIAFKDGLDGSAQLNELVSRKPWGTGTPDTAEEIKSQLETKSPFLIITLTKNQALTLDDHRDIIRWVLVQSTSKTCE